MKALVTGAAGFVGSTLAGRLLADGHDVVGVDAFTDYYDPQMKRTNLRRLENPRFRLVEADLDDIDLGPLTVDADVVFHEAGQPGVRRRGAPSSAATPPTTCCATQRLLESARGPTTCVGSCSPPRPRSTAMPRATRARRPTCRGR